MERVVSDLKYTRTDRKSVGHAASHLLHPTQSSTLGETAIPPALFPVAEAISSTSVGQARTHCVHPIHSRRDSQVVRTTHIGNAAIAISTGMSSARARSSSRSS